MLELAQHTDLVNQFLGVKLFEQAKALLRLASTLAWEGNNAIGCSASGRCITPYHELPWGMSIGCEG